jgi:DNA-directed RNA polymerase subunit beta'
MMFADMAEVHQALEAKAVTLHSKVMRAFRRPTRTARRTCAFETTPGVC